MSSGFYRLVYKVTEIFFEKTLAEKSTIPIFASPIAKPGTGLTHGVMVTLLILVQSFKVRILMGQQEVKSRLIAAFFVGKHRKVKDFASFRSFLKKPWFGL